MRPARRRAFTLVELLCVMVGIEVALGFGAIMLIAAMRADQMSASGIERLRRHVELAQAFRSDVAAAESVPDQAAGYTNNPHCLVLQLPGSHYVIYNWGNGRLDRIVNGPDGAVTQMIRVGTGNVDLEFSRSEPEQSVLHLRVRDSMPNGAVRITNLAACLGGDRK